MEHSGSYVLLFLSSFLSATLLPGSSELLLVGLLGRGHNPMYLWAGATSANTLGAMVNWALGRWLLRFQNKRWFPFKPGQLGSAQGWFQRYGIWTLLFSWAPIVGDSFTFIAGVMRVRFWLFALLTSIGKGARYAVVVGLTTELYG